MKKTLITTCSALALIVASCSDHHDQMKKVMERSASTVTEMPKTADPEVDYPKMMIAHHEGAIAMAKLELKDGKDDSLKRTAQKIIAEQEANIETLKAMKGELPMDYHDTAYAADVKAAMDKMQRTAEEKTLTGNVDQDFANFMIAHHDASIDNSFLYIYHGSNDELKDKAMEMASTQTSEMEEMQDWLDAKKME